MVINKKIWFLLWVTFNSIILNTFSQDIQFSQFYAAAQYLNPAFAGSAHNTRAMLHQRLQWPSLDARYFTTYFSVDHFFDKYSSGVGLYVLRDVQGKNVIGTNEVALQYSYQVRLSEKLALRTGLQAGFINRNLDYTHLFYPDQLDNQGLNGQKTQDPNYYSTTKTFLDVGTGGVLFSERFWFSYAADHLTTPNQSFWGENSRLPVKHSFTSGYRIYLIKGETKAHIGHHIHSLIIIPTAHYKLQGKSDQLDVGAYLFYDQYLMGIWYRGIPIKKYNSNLQNNESFVALIGWKYKAFRASYSYDFVISNLSVARTGGAHEINLTYIFDNKKKVKKMKVLPCPDHDD